MSEDTNFHECAEFDPGGWEAFREYQEMEARGQVCGKNGMDAEEALFLVGNELLHQLARHGTPANLQGWVRRVHGRTYSRVQIRRIKASSDSKHVAQQDAMTRRGGATEWCILEERKVEIVCLLTRIQREVFEGCLECRFDSIASVSKQLGRPHSDVRNHLRGIARKIKKILPV